MPRFLVILCALFAIAAKAEYVSPQKVSVQTPSYQPERIIFTPSRYVYSVDWQGIPVATAEVTAEFRTPGDLSTAKVSARARTAKGIDLLYKLRHDSESVFRLNSFQPIRYTMKQKENKRRREFEISFHPDGNVVTISRRDQKPPEIVQFHPQNQMLDPISAGFLARSLPISVGAEAKFDVFNGKNRFLITFRIAAIDNIVVGGKSYRAYRAEPTVKKLTDTKGENRLRYAAIWISADDRREVLKLESRVLIGSVRARLERIEPLAEPAAPTVAPHSTPQ